MAGKACDAYSLLCYLEQHSGWEEVVSVLQSARDSGRSVSVSAVSWGEAFAALSEELGRPRAEEVMQALETLPIEIIGVDAHTAKEAASLRVAKGLSYESAFAVALASKRKATLVTGDRSLAVVDGNIKIKWLEQDSTRGS